MKYLTVLLMALTTSGCIRSYIDDCKNQVMLMDRPDLEKHCETWDGAWAIKGEYHNFIINQIRNPKAEQE
jgi:hypothetical protein